MNVKIKFTGELTALNIKRTQAADDMRTELEAILKDAVWGELTLTDYEQEYYEDEN